MTDRVLTAEEYVSAVGLVQRRDKPLVHRAILAEIERLVERAADALEAKDGIGVMEIADEISRLRTILAAEFA